MQCLKDTFRQEVEIFRRMHLATGLLFHGLSQLCYMVILLIHDAKVIKNYDTFQMFWRKNDFSEENNP